MPYFNKMFVMIPVMLAARKLDGDDPATVTRLRIAYGVVQTLCLLIVLYTYVRAQAVTSTRVIYVPPPAVPFASESDTKKKYTEISFAAHVQSTARSLVGSTAFGIALTVGLHYYKGMVMGLAIQAVMGPLNLLENALVKALFFGQGLIEDEKIFDEKSASELSPDDEVIDTSGNIVVRAPTTKAETKSLEDLLLDTWDLGNKADLAPLMKALTKKNVNYQTSEDHWTPLMILAGLDAKGTASAIRVVKELGANPAITDKEGWTALHWAAFHGSVAAARELASETKLLAVKDKDGNTPLETARKENNTAVADVFEAALGESKKTK